MPRAVVLLVVVVVGVATRAVMGMGMGMATSCFEQGARLEERLAERVAAMQVPRLIRGRGARRGSGELERARRAVRNRNGWCACRC